MNIPKLIKLIDDAKTPEELQKILDEYCQPVPKGLRRFRGMKYIGLYHPTRGGDYLIVRDEEENNELGLVPIEEFLY